MTMTADPVRTYGDAYCVIDMHNLFVGTTLEDEVLLLGQGRTDADTIRAVCHDLGVTLQPGRCLQTCSGGQQALICCALLMTLLPGTTPRILLVHVLETLSAANRQRLLQRFARVLPQTALFTLTDHGPEHISTHA